MNYLENLRAMSIGNDPVYDAFREAIKSFDTGLVAMFLFSQADIDYSQEHGDLPEGAQPLDLAIRHAPMSSQSKGQVHPPWLIAQRLREVADTLDKIARDQMEQWYAEERKEGNAAFSVGEGEQEKLPELEARLERLKSAQKAWFGWDGENTDEQFIEFLQELINDGVGIPSIEKQELDAVSDRLTEILDTEVKRIGSWIGRIKASTPTDHE